MLLCDGCDQGYHLDCLNPVLDAIPIGVWYCDECIRVSDEEDDEDEEDEEVRSFFYYLFRFSFIEFFAQIGCFQHTRIRNNNE